LWQCRSSLWKAENTHKKKAVEVQSLETSCSLKHLNLPPLARSEFQASPGSKGQMTSLLLLNAQWKENKWIIQFLLYLYMFCLVNITEKANSKMNFNVQAS